MIENELFFIHDEKGPILYAPLINFSARVNEPCIEVVKRKLDGEEPQPGDVSIIEYLSSFGLFDKVEPPDIERSLPTEVTLFTSDVCNLRCIYCYADCDGEKHPMPLSLGKAAIDRVIQNAIAQNKDSVVIKFHGNGEPFTAFDVVKDLCSYAKARAEEQGVSVTTIVVSNGFWSEEILSWVIREIDDIAISFDGNREVQNMQRPTLTGGESFQIVDRTLRELNRHEKSFGIKVTVTDKSVGSITDIARHVAESYPRCGWLQFEPVWNVGRFADADEPEPYYDRFVEEFIRADKAYGDKLRLVYATADIDKIRISCCGASKGHFVVTSRGLVTSCYEVYDKDDPRSDVFIYGRYNEAHGFYLDDKKLKNLRGYAVNNMPYCEKCFCKYHCAGDCPAKLLGTDPADSFGGSERCRITRAIASYFIGKRLS